MDKRYTKTHEWIMIEGNTLTIGISDHARHELGDIVFVELPEVGAQYAANDSFAVVESVKAVSDIYAPVAGKVTEVNSKLEDNPELLGSSEEFIIKLETQDAAEIESITMGQSDYESFIEVEG